MSKGFSLIEMLIAMTISVAIGGLLISIFIQNNSLSRDQVLKTSQALSDNNAYSKISSDLRQATAIATTYNAPPVYTTNSNTLILQIPSLDSQGNIISSASDYVVVAPDSTKPTILREHIYPNASSTRPSGNTVLSNSLKSVTFYYLDANLQPVAPTSAVTVNFVINQLSSSGQTIEQSSSSGQINLRNN